jgi:histidine triad (HIT) family protein
MNIRRMINLNCLFCKITNHEIEANIIYEDDLVVCFLDAFPDSNGHLLIVPKEHTLDIDTIPLDTLNHIWRVAKDMKALLYDKLHCDGLTFMQNNGDVQEVKHFHLHLKPHYKEPAQKMDPKDVLKILKSNE